MYLDSFIEFLLEIKHTILYVCLFNAHHASIVRSAIGSVQRATGDVYCVRFRVVETNSSNSYMV